MELVVFHRTYSKYQTINVPRMDADVDLLLKAHLDRLVNHLNGNVSDDEDESELSE